MTPPSECNWFDNLFYVIMSAEHMRSESKKDNIDGMKYFVDMMTNCGGNIP